MIANGTKPQEPLERKQGMKGSIWGRRRKISGRRGFVRTGGCQTEQETLGRAT